MSQTRNSRLLNSFVKYCNSHPEQRFWQALRNWSGWGFVFVGNYDRATNDVHPIDTFYFEQNGKEEEKFYGEVEEDGQEP